MVRDEDEYIDVEKANERRRRRNENPRGDYNTNDLMSSRIRNNFIDKMGQMGR
jgi:hypothetical protein